MLVTGKGDIRKYIVLICYLRTHAREARARARIYDKNIIYQHNTPCENDTTCHKRKTGLLIKNINQENRVDKSETLYK